MGSSAREIEREIRQTRERLDDNRDELEGRAASRALRYGRIAAVVLGVTAAGAAALLIWRKTRRPSFGGRLAIDSLRDLAVDVSDKLPPQAD